MSGTEREREESIRDGKKMTESQAKWSGLRI